MNDQTAIANLEATIATRMDAIEGRPENIGAEIHFVLLAVERVTRRQDELESRVFDIETQLHGTVK